MKKYYLGLAVLVFVLTLVGCKSKEDKALELIDKEMFQTLYDYDSYQPVETKIDSAFTTYLMDDSISGIAADISVLRKLREEASEEAESAESELDIWADSYYTRDRFIKAKNEYVDAKLRELGYLEREIDEMKLLFAYVLNFKSEYCGWEVTHKFRCKSKGGTSLLTTYHYIINENVDSILYYWDEEDEVNTELQAICNEAEKATKEDVEKMDAAKEILEGAMAKFVKARSI